MGMFDTDSNGGLVHFAANMLVTHDSECICSLCEPPEAVKVPVLVLPSQPMARGTRTRAFADARRVLAVRRAIHTHGA